MMTSYKIRSRALVDLVNEIRTGRLILSPYFQRELVWRKMHKQDFITTILLGFPFPQIFVSRGNIDVEKMVATSLIVDGQQRMSAIREFVDSKLDVNGRLFKNFSPEEKEEFLKYEVSVIDIDLPDNDSRIKDIFKRLNRTFYSLTEIEKLSSEYSTSEFMLLAKLLTRQIDICDDANDLEDSGVDQDDESDEVATYAVDPNIPASFLAWAKTQSVANIRTLILERSIFTGYEISRQVHLIFTLNILSTIVGNAFFSRNSKTREFLDEYKEAVPDKDGILENLEGVAEFILRMGIPSTSYWNNKANIFSMIICLYRNGGNIGGLDPRLAARRLEQFAANIPAEYEMAAKEAVNRKRERVIRNRYLEEVIFGRAQSEDPF